MAKSKVNTAADQTVYKQPPSLIQVLVKTLSQNFTVISGTPEQVKIEEIAFDDFQTHAGKIKSGRFLSVYSLNDRPAMTFLVPEIALKSYLKKFSDIHEEKTEDATITKLVGRIAGNLPEICGIRWEGEVRSVLSFPKPYTAELRDQVYWDASECVVYQCTALGALFYVYINFEVQKLIGELLKTDTAYVEAVRSRVLSQFVDGEGELTGQPGQKEDDGTGTESGGTAGDDPVRITIKNPLEFLLGSCFLPRQAYVGKKNISTVFKEMIVTDKVGEYIDGGFLWFRFWIEADDEAYPVFYTVDVKGQTAKYKTFFERLFTDLLKSTAMFLKKQIGLSRVGGKIVAPPPEDSLNGSVIFNTALNLETREIGCRLIIPPGFFSAYLIKLLEPWETEPFEKNLFTTALSVLSVNATLFGKNIDSFYRQSGLHQAEDYTPSLGVSEIVSILDVEDSKRLVQNYFLANGWSVNDFQSLFLYKYYTDEDADPKIARDALFDKEQYKKFFPKALQDDWKDCNGVASSYEELAGLNEKALRGVFSALQSDKLLMPYKAFYMLFNEFQKPLDEKFRNKIDALHQENRWSEYLEAIPKKFGQQEISAVPTDKLAVALIHGQPAVSDVARYMSKTKRQELEEEIRIQKKKYDQGIVSAELVFTGMSDFLAVLERLAMPEDEMIE